MSQRSLAAHFLPNQMKTYTISEAATLSGLPESTLRYYERIGLIDRIDRDESSKRRVYSQDDIDRIALIASLNATGMSIESMRSYLRNRLNGADKARDQIDILNERKKQLDEDARLLRLRSQYVEAKIAYWEAVERGDSSEIDACSATTYAIAAKMNLPRSSKNNT